MCVPAMPPRHSFYFKLLNWGFNAHDARRDLAYDVVVDLGGRLCRVQVKGRSRAVNGRWDYRAIRGNWRSATGTMPTPKQTLTCQRSSPSRWSA